MKISAHSPIQPGARVLARILALLALACALCAPTLAQQQTTGGTVISNEATASYTDGSTTYNTKSLPVTVTVANVSGLNITPDGQANSTVVPGKTNVPFVFTVTNTGNFDDTVRFLASGGSISISGPGTITDAFVDNVTVNNTWEAGEQRIFGNGAVVDQTIKQSGDSLNRDRFYVVVLVNISNAATTGQSIRVQLGNEPAGSSPYDNLASTGGVGNEVRTLTASANGTKQAGGDSHADVANDAQLQVSLAAPAGPIALGSDISYTVGVCNTGARDAAAISLSGNSGVFIIVPVNPNTVIKASQPFTGSLLTLYTTDGLNIAPTAASWLVAPASLPATTTRIALKVATPLLANSSPCSANIPVVMTVKNGIDATNPIRMMVDAFANNSIASLITDQSDGQSTGPQIPGKGDGNALNPNVAQPNASSGTPLQTTLQQVGDVLNGPLNQPGASGPNNTDDDYTNKSVNTGIATVAPGGNSTAAGNAIEFDNTLQNNGNSNDTYTLSVLSFPPNGASGGGVTVRISTNGGTSWVVLVNNGVATGAANPTVAVAFNTPASYKVEVTLPSGLPVLVGYDTVIRATSANTNTVHNDTIDRVYTGFVQLDKSVSAIINSDLTKGGPNDPVPGAIIEYTVAYKNVSSNAGSNNGLLNATSVTITDLGTGVNNWTANATYVANSASSQLVFPVATSPYGNITVSGSPVDSVAVVLPGLQAGARGTFKFRVTIK
jgi:hypothetical protein